MPAFRGVYDGSVEIGQNREARNTQMEMQRRQIAAQMAMQQQQLAATAANQGAALSASTEQANADRALKAQGMKASTDLAGQELQLKRDEFASADALGQTKQATAMLMLQQAQQEFEADQAQRAAQTTFRQSAFGAGLLSAMLNGVTPTTTLSKINQANGVADGEPGSIVGMGGGPDGAWYDVIAQDEQGNIGKKRQEVDPMAILTVAHSVLGDKGAAEFVQMYKTKDTNNTRMNVAMDSYLRALEVENIKTQRAAQLQEMKGDQSLAVEDKKTDRAMRVQTLKQQVGGALGLQPAKVDLATSVTKLGAILDTYDADMKSAKKKGLPPDPEKVALRAKTKALLDKVLAIGEEPGATAAPAAPAAEAPAAAASGKTTFKDGDTRDVNGVTYTRTNGVWVSE